MTVQEALQIAAEYEELVQAKKLVPSRATEALITLGYSIEVQAQLARARSTDLFQRRNEPQ